MMKNILWFGKTGEANAWYHISLSAAPSYVENVYVVRHREPVRAVESDKIHYHLAGSNDNFLVTIWKLCVKAFQVLKTSEIDSVITYNVFPYGFFAYLIARFKKKKLVLCFIGADYNYYLQKQPFRFLIRRSLEYSSIIICKGHHMTEGLLHIGTDKRKLAYYPHFVSREWFVNGSKEQTEFDLISVCELIPRKRVDVLIRAVSLLKHQGIILNACIVGEGKEYDALKALTDELDVASQIHFAGFQKEVVSYLIRSKIYVQTSRGEGLSLSLLESMAAGLVPVCTVAGSERDIIENDVNGLFIEIGNTNDLVEKVNYLLEGNNYERLRLANLNRRDQFTLENAGKTMEKILTIE
jgi:glycosyltransferase involved in cell wall biosynthesis